MLSSSLVLSQLIVGAVASCGQGFMLIKGHSSPQCHSSVEEFSFSKSTTHTNALMDLTSFLVINDLTGAPNAGLNTYNEPNWQGTPSFIPHVLLNPGDCWTTKGLFKSFEILGLSKKRDELPPIALELTDAAENDTAAENQTAAWKRGDPPRNYYLLDLETGVVTKTAPPLARRDAVQSPVGRRYTQGQVTLRLLNEGTSGGRTFGLSEGKVYNLAKDICQQWDGEDEAVATIRDDYGNNVELSWEPTENANLNTVPSNLLYSTAYEFAYYEGSRLGQGQALIEIWNNEATVRYGHLILERA